MIFVSPAEHATVNPTIDVELRAAFGLGTPLTISSATVAVRPESADTFGVEHDATLRLTRALVTNLVLSPGQTNQLRATVNTSNPACAEATATIWVTAREAPIEPKVTAVSFAQDVNHDGVLSSAELPPGTNINMTVTAADTTSSTLVRVLSGVSAVSLRDVYLSGGTAQVEIPIVSNAGTFDLFALLVDDEQALNTPERNPEALASISVNRSTPSCEITTKDVLGPGDDATVGVSAFGLRVTGLLGPTATKGSFQIDSATPRAVTAVEGAVSTDFAVPKTGDAVYTLRLEATDTVGNTCTAIKLVRVDLHAPVVSLELREHSDGGVEVVTTTPAEVTIRATGAAEADRACLYRQQGSSGRQLVGCEGLTAAGIATVSAAFSSDGAYELIAEVQDAAKNTGSVSKTVSVSLSVCGLAFATIAGKSAQCPSFLSASATNQLAVSLTTSPTCAGLPISLFFDGTLVGSSTGGDFSVTAPEGTHVMRGEIPNPTGPNTSVSCTLEVNSNAAPVFTSPSADGVATLTQAQDSQPLTPGAQRPLTFTAVVPTGARVEVCADTLDPGIVGPNAAACSDGEAGWFVYRSKTNVTSPDFAFTYAEGSYHLRLVVVAFGSTIDSSLDLALIVDVTAPCVSDGGLSLSQDLNADNKLNLAELAAAAPRLQIILNEACGSAISAQVKSAVSSPTYSDVIANPTSPVSLDLTGLASTEAVDLYVELIDAVGNKSTAAATAGRLAVLVDRDLPACSFAVPSKSTLNVSDVSAGLLDVQLQTSADVAAVPIQLAGSTVFAGVIAPSAVASASFSISGTQTQVLSATCVDAAGNQAAATVSLTWDLEPPTCAFTAPAPNTTSTTNDITTTLTIGAAEGRLVHLFTSAQAAEVGSLPVSSGAATGVVTGYPNGANQTWTARVSDSAGNECVATLTGITVSSTRCNLSTNAYVNGTSLWLNQSNTASAASGRTADLVATSNCASGQTVTVTRTAPTNALLQTRSTNGSGVATFTGLSVSDGDVLAVVIDNGSGLTTTRVITADFTLPSVGSVTVNGTVPPTGAVFFVAPGLGTSAQNRQVQLGTAGYYADSDGVTAGAQLSVGLDTITGGTASGVWGFATILFKGSPVISPLPITTATHTFASIAATLPHHDVGTLVVRVTDQAGNSVDAFSQTATIDVIAPSKPAAITRTLVSARDATVTLSWNPVGDDALVGTVKDYDVRWTTSSTNAHRQMALESDFFGGSTYRDSASAASATRITRGLVLPPLNTYYIAVRARDEVDNYSAYEAPTPVVNAWSRVALTGTAGTHFGHTVLAQGSLNNDTVTDLVVTATSSTLAGAVYVYYGGQAFGAQSTCVAPACTVITAPATASAPGTFFGADVSMSGNVGDSAAEAKSDLLIGQTLFTNSNGPGRAFLFFGTAAATIDLLNFVEIRGERTPPPDVVIGLTAKILSDLDGDGLDEVVLAAPSYSLPGVKNKGRLSIFKGRSVAAWRALRTAADKTTNAPFIPIASADWVVEGVDPQTLTTPAASPEYFAVSRLGLSSLGDLDGDGKNEFTVGLGPTAVNQVWLYKGAASGPTLLQALTRPQGTDLSSQWGFGAAILTGFNVMNGSGADLIATWPLAGELFIYADLGPTGAPLNPSLTIRGVSRFGSTVSAGTLDTTDTMPDLLVGQDVTTDSNAWVLWNQSGSFTTTVDFTTPQFWVSRFDGTALAGGLSTNSLGKTNAMADLNADGPVDVILADELNNVVFVWK